MHLRSTIGPLFILFVVSCTHKTAQQQLKEFINDPENNIKQSIQVGDVHTVVRLLPAHFRNLPESEIHPVNNPALDNYYYFDVRFEPDKKEKPEKEKVLYLNFDMQNDFTLFCQGDSVAPAICQKIENGIGGSYQYMLAFENNNKRIDASDFSLVYKDKIFGIGVLAFVYKKEDVRKIPGFQNYN